MPASNNITFSVQRSPCPSIDRDGRSTVLNSRPHRQSRWLNWPRSWSPMHHLQRFRTSYARGKKKKKVLKNYLLDETPLYFFVTANVETQQPRASTLSLTTTTFMPPSTKNPVIVAMTPNGRHEVMDFDFRHRYEAALRDAMTWEKKYSSAQHQIHYEREQWEGNDAVFLFTACFRSAKVLTIVQIAQ